MAKASQIPQPLLRRDAAIIVSGCGRGQPALPPGQHLGPQAARPGPLAWPGWPALQGYPWPVRPARRLWLGGAGGGGALRG
ncbi:hypothetical protein G1E_34010, partial [Pseudomonas sp. TJI-51]